MAQLLIRTDASPAIGSGHVVRCLALAQFWRERVGGVRFVSRCDNAALADRMREVGEVYAPNKWDIAWKPWPTWCVVDGYPLEVEAHAFAETGAKVLVIDDQQHYKRYPYELLLNVNADAESYAYPGATKLLLGPRYALLRREFKAYRDCRRRIADRATKVLVTMGGGAGPEAWVRLHQRAFPLLDKMGFEFRYPTGFNDDMPALMAWADMAIIAGGGTTYECLAMGLPSLVLSIADNQEGNAAALSAAGLAHYVGRVQDVSLADFVVAVKALAEDATLRRLMSDAGRETVDGCGAQRIVEAMVG